MCFVCGERTVDVNAINFDSKIVSMRDRGSSFFALFFSRKTEQKLEKSNSMQTLPRTSFSAARAAIPRHQCSRTTTLSSLDCKSSSFNAGRGQKLGISAIDRRPLLPLPLLLTPRRPTSSSSSSSSPSSPCSLAPAATEFLSAAFVPASPGIQPSLVVNAVVFALGARVLSAGLTPLAVAASFLLGTLTFAAFGWRGYLLVCGYFVAGSAVTKLKLAQKQAEGIAEARGGRRAPGSVVGSGLAGALASAAALAFSAKSTNSAGRTSACYALCATAFVASFASKLADTASSEVGKAFGTDAYLSTTLRKVPRGTEGAVSAEGSLAGLAAAAAVSAVSVLIKMIPFKAAVAAALAAVVANAFESLLGATAQSGEKNALLNLSNDAVNAIQICIAATLAAAAAKALSLV